MKCNINNTIINYGIKGSGKTILMLNGFATDMTSMIGCMETLFENKEGWKRIYIDHPGVGKTIIGDSVKNYNDVLDIIINFIDIIIPNEKFAIAGSSFGGYLARYILNKKQDMINGLLLIYPLIIPQLEKCDVDRETKVIKDLDENIQEKIDSRISTEVNGAMENTNFEFLQKLSSESNRINIDVDNLEKQFDKPTLILTGKQDSIVGYRDAFNIINNYPRATFCVLDKAGHNLQIEQENLFNSLVNEWLYRMDEI